MANSINRKDLWVRLENVSAKQWRAAGERIPGVLVFPMAGKGSHCILWDECNPARDNPQYLIATIQKKTYKQANHSIFKNLLSRGIEEDDIWRGLGFLS